VKRSYGTLGVYGVGVWKRERERGKREWRERERERETKGHEPFDMHAPPYTGSHFRHLISHNFPGNPSSKSTTHRGDVVKRSYGTLGVYGVGVWKRERERGERERRERARERDIQEVTSPSTCTPPYTLARTRITLPI